MSSGRTARPIDLDASCGDHFTFRDLVECGETWCRLHAEGRSFENVPVDPSTLDAMRELCRVVLDPVTVHFERPQLTYGFASAALTRHIRSHICPPRDQHAGCELNREGALICPRYGMAVDFRVPGVPARTVASWITRNTAFDRLYLYGPDRPIHVSVGPEQSRAVVEMTQLPNGRRVPRMLRTLP